MGKIVQVVAVTRVPMAPVSEVELRPCKMREVASCVLVEQRKAPLQIPLYPLGVPHTVALVEAPRKVADLWPLRAVAIPQRKALC